MRFLIYEMPFFATIPESKLRVVGNNNIVLSSCSKKASVFLAFGYILGSPKPLTKASLLTGWVQYVFICKYVGYLQGMPFDFFLMTRFTVIVCYAVGSGESQWVLSEHERDLSL